MIQYLVTYSIQSGHEEDHGNLLCESIMNYLKQQPGFQRMETYSTLVGSGPDWVLEIDFDSSENLMRALGTEQAKGFLEDFEHLVTNLSTKILEPTGEPVGAGK